MDRRLATRLGLGLMLAFAFACSDAASNKGDTTEDVDTGPGPGIDPGKLDAGMGPPVNQPDARRQLVIQGDTNVLVFTGQSVMLPVKYLDVNGVPVTMDQVTAQLIDNQGMDRTAQGIEGSILEVSRKTPDAAGLASFNLLGGNLRTSFRVRATAPGADPVQWTVSVARPGEGVLAVRVHYDVGDNMTDDDMDNVVDEGRYTWANLSQAQVRLYDQFNCDFLEQSIDLLISPNPESPPPPARDELPAISPFSEVQNEVSVPLGEATVSVLAFGVSSATGNKVAWGCVDGVEIQGGNTTVAEVFLDDLEFKYSSKIYRMTNKFDLTDLLSNSGIPALETVDTVLDVLGIIGGGGADPNERGNAVIRLFCDDIFGLDGSVCDLLERVNAGRIVDELIDGVLAEQAPEVLRVLTIIGDVYRIISQMELTGRFEFQPAEGSEFAVPDAEGTINGFNSWQSLKVTWQDNCPPELQAMNDCEREFSLGSVGGNPRGPVRGDFVGVDEVGTLYVTEHSLTLAYGQIILGLAENWVIPAVLGTPGQPITFEEMLEVLLGGICEDVNNAVGGIEICQVLIDTLGALLRDQLDNLVLDVDAFTISGRAETVDGDGDLVIDEFRNGVWCGVIDFGGTPVPFRGCFAGCLETVQGCDPSCVITNDVNACPLMMAE